MGLDNLLLAASLIAPLCIVWFGRRELISVPLGIIAFIACTANPFETDDGIPAWLGSHTFLGFLYVWFIYGWRRVYLWLLSARGTAAIQRPPAVLRWALLCTWTCNATLLYIFILQRWRGYPYLDDEAFPIRAGFIEIAFLVSTALLFVASPLLFERCGALAFISWMTVMAFLLLGPLTRF